ncbi:MAG: folate-binding protein YgfZ [Verrucomicrobiales bacterium]|nr:folate-binding protein YgfZ [Verrucomicrobiales bacterium]
MRWVDFSEQRAFFRLTGPDRVRFLNGQVSNQVDRDLSALSIEACVCTLKGKVQSLIHITGDPDCEALLIDAEIDQREDVFERLDRYLIADDCELEDVTGTVVLWHGFGEDSTAAENPETSRRSHRLGPKGWDVFEKPAGESLERIQEGEIEELRIEFGIPKWGHELTGEEFPAEVGLDRRAVDFHKGCYLGQEVVSRIESVGRVKRGLCWVEGDQDLVCGPVLSEDVEVGKLTTVKGFQGLALLNRSFTSDVEESRLLNGLRLREFRSA